MHDLSFLRFPQILQLITKLREPIAVAEASLFLPSLSRCGGVGEDYDLGEALRGRYDSSNSGANDG
jgi:hypothetical protein